MCLARGPLRSWESERGPRSHTYTHTLHYIHTATCASKTSGGRWGGGWRCFVPQLSPCHARSPLDDWPWVGGKPPASSSSSDNWGKRGKTTMTNIYRLIVREREKGGGSGSERGAECRRTADCWFTKCCRSQRVVQNVLFIPRRERN